MLFSTSSLARGSGRAAGRGSGPNLENDTEERNAQEERSRGEADRKGNPRGGSGREAGDAAKDSEDSEEFRCWSLNESEGEDI